MLVKVKDPTTRELYAGQLAGILRMEPQQVRRAMQEAAAATQRQARPHEPARRRRRRQTGARRSRRATGPSDRACPARSWSCWSCSRSYPELLRSPEATRAGDLLVHPLARQLYRAAAEQAAETGDAGRPGLAGDVARGRSRRRSRRRSMDDRFAKRRRSRGRTCGNW